MRLQLSAFFDPAGGRLRFVSWRRGLQLAWQTTVYGGLALLGLLVLAWLTLQWGILPHIEDWRPAIERHASRAVGVPVRIGHISVRSSGWMPTLELRDVVLRDSQGAEALRLPRVSAALSARSLLLLQPRLSQLYVEGARVLVRRDRDGHLHIGGLDVTASSASVASTDEAAAFDWFFSQQELVLRHGAVRWIDEQRAAPALTLDDVDIVVRNGLRSHAVRIDATPPLDWGDRVSLRLRARQPLFARAGDWRRWRGTLFADLPRADVAQLEQRVDLPIELAGGDGSLRLWLDFQNDRWRVATADVRLNRVMLRLADNVQPLAVAHASGRLSAERDPAGVSLAADHFGFETAAGVVWPAGNLRLAWRQKQAGLVNGRRARPGDAAASPTSGASVPLLWDAAAPITGGRLSADQLDLTLMRRVAASLPLPSAARQWLADYQPEGVVRNLVARWSGSPQAPATYRASATVTGWSMAAGAVPVGARPGRPGRPGWRRAALQFEASEVGGSARVALDGGSITLPGVFEQPEISFDRFGAIVDWTVGAASRAGAPPPLSVSLRDVHFANADAAGTFQLQWHTGADVESSDSPRGGGRSSAAPASAAAFGRGQRFPGQLDLTGRLDQAHATALARYLPLSVPEKTRRYFQAALVAGAMEAIDFKVRGDVAGFPYARLHDGEFRIAGRVKDVDFDVQPSVLADSGASSPNPSALPSSTWPHFTQARAQVVFDRGTFAIRDASARAGELELRNVRGDIPTLYDEPVFALQGQGTGSLPGFLHYVAQSPIGGWLHHGLAAATASGEAALDIALAIPLKRPLASTVKGTLTLADDDVRIVPDAPTLAHAHARIDFTEHGVTVSDAGGQAVGGDTSVAGGTQPDGSLRFVARGSASADGLRRATEAPLAARFAANMNGRSAYELQIDIVKGQTAVALTSPLTGLGLSLPAPLDKPADATWPLRVATTVSIDAQGHPHDTLRVDLSRPQGLLLQAQVERDLGGAVPRPVSAAYAIGAPLPAPSPGGLLVLHGAAFNGDAWWTFWRGLSPSAPAGATVVAAAGAPEEAPSYLPVAAVLAVHDLLLGGRHLTDANVRVARVIEGGEELWRSDVASEQTTGVVEYRPDGAGRGAQLFARLDRLSLDAHDNAADVPEAAPGTPPVPAATVPALDIVVDNFELNGRKLGKLEVAATLQAGDRDWRLTKLALTTPEAALLGSGSWSGAPARRMSLDFDLDLKDSGALLERLGLGRVIKRGKGKLSGAVTWIGSPLSLDYPSLEGKLHLALDAGQFLKADAGAGRLLGVLSLQSLPRRLLLDFRDVFQEGFAFDSVAGNVAIDKGVASTGDLRMRGVNAAVLMSGHADLKAETQDLDVIVVPEVNAGAASLAYVAINPVIGLGTFLAQLFLRHPLAEAGTREFHVTGTWAAPKVDPMPHEAAVAAAAAAASQAKAK